jgi:hypothetical protein
MNMVEHLKSRHLDMSLHTVWFDQAEGVASFPFWNLSGCLTRLPTVSAGGRQKEIQQSALEGRYYTYRIKIQSRKKSVL